MEKLWDSVVPLIMHLDWPWGGQWVRPRPLPAVSLQTKTSALSPPGSLSVFFLSKHINFGFLNFSFSFICAFTFFLLVL